MSKIEVNAIEPQSGTTLTLGASGDTITIPSGATINNQGSAVNFGPTGAVSWNTTKVTTGFTATAGIGYFCDTTSAAFTVTLPATPAAGAVIGITDYANTFATNNLTLNRNGSKIGGATQNAVLSTNGIAVTFVYVDSTQGWIVTDSGNRSDLPVPQFIVATGGTITTCGDFKIHTFTGPGTFTVCSGGNALGSNSVDYLVVAGGGGGGGGASSGQYGGGGGGAGGYITSFPGGTKISTTAGSYPITIGGGGPGGPSNTSSKGTNGSSSIFSTITSAGGGGAGAGNGNQPGLSGGSGGGGGTYSGTAGSGNTPPVSPPQGNNGGAGSGVNEFGGGGGGASATGTSAGPGSGPGGAGSANSISGSPVTYAGGGGGGKGLSVPGPAGSGGPGGGGPGGANNGGVNQVGTAGTTNTGGGGGGGGGGAAGSGSSAGGSGGSGIVVIRYKFQ